MSGSYDPSSVNGFLLDGKFVPETALEILLSFVPVQDILKLRQVCQVWRNIGSRRSFWKEVFENNGLDWKIIPNHIKGKEDGWMVLYCEARYGIFTRNLVRNPCGRAGFAHWEKLQDSGHRIIVESPLVGVNPLPEDRDYAGEVDSAFVTSYGWSTIRQKIDLKDAGLTPKIIKTMIPFQFVCKQMVGVRFDCGGMFCTCLCLLDDQGKTIMYDMMDEVHQAGENWFQSSSTLSVLQENPRLHSARYLAVIISGKDSQFWAGHYGPKFSRICVTTKCLTPEEAECIPPPQLSVKNEQVSDLFFSYRGRNFWSDIIPGLVDGGESDSDSEDDIPQVRQANNNNNCTIF